MKKISTITILLFTAVTLAGYVFALEKKSKPTSSKKVISINDENVEINLKKAEELLKKGDYPQALDLFQRIYEYSKEILKIIEIAQEKQKEAIEGTSLDQKTQEALMLRAKRRETLRSRYRAYFANSAYYCGYIYARRNDTEGATRYLIDALKNTSFSDKPDSIYVKSISLLARIYALEGEL